MQRHSTSDNIFTIQMHKRSIIRIHINIKRECYIIDRQTKDKDKISIDIIGQYTQSKSEKLATLDTQDTRLRQTKQRTQPRKLKR